MLDPPVVTVTLKPGAWVDPERMTKAIKNAGFTPVPEEVRLTLTGRLEARDGRFVLVLSGMRAPREVIGVPPSGPEAEAVAARLQEMAGRDVTVDGRWLFGETARIEVGKITEPI